jgi:signal transduction histidine kinase
VALRDPGASAESLRATCRRVLAAGAEQERLIQALLTLARGQRGTVRRQPLDLAAVTRDVLAARGTEVAVRGLTMDVTLAPALLAGDLPLTERAVANLVDNALRHNVPDGTVQVTVGTESGRGLLTVANSGPVVPPRDLDRLLLPFQRRAPSRIGSRTGPRDDPGAAGPDSGLGLGLPIVQAIAVAHDGTLTLRARPGGGLIAELAFPGAAAAWPGLRPAQDAVTVAV